MDLRKVLALRGPNVWRQAPAIEAWLDLKTLDLDARTIAGFEERLAAALPELVMPISTDPRAELTGLRLAEVLGRVAVEIQRLAGVKTEFSQARATHEAGVYRVGFEYEEETLARECLDVAWAVCRAWLEDRILDVAAEVNRLRALAYQVRLGPSTLAIVEAAQRRGIPSRRLTEGSLVQLGQGARLRRILTAETDRTGAIAQWIAQDKDLTRTLLREAGIPVPEGRPVQDRDDAWAAAQEIEGPVVVKPRYGNQGRGVATNLSTREQVVAAYEAAAEQSSWIVVERFSPGSDYRLLVVGQKLVAAARREPAEVTGDGVRSIRSLVEAANRDPRRSEGHATALSPIPLDAVSLGVLAEQGFRPESVPPAGTVVLIRRNANLSTGGTAADVTDQVHPEVAARAVEAAQVVGLDIAGVDIVATAIDRPLEDQGGVIVEVNAGPGLRMHLEPTTGEARPVGEAIVDLMFPQGETGRIPVVAVTGVNGKTTTTRLIAHLLRGAGLRVGMTNTDGIYLGERLIAEGDCSGPASARMIVSNPAIDAAVLETARGGILRAGLGFDRCQVAVVTNIAEGDHLGLSDIETLDELARVKRVIVEAVLPDGAAVLNADDPRVAAMAGFCPGPITYFARDGQNPIVFEHRARGGRAVFMRDGQIVLAEGDRETPLMPVASVPLTHRGRVMFQVENTLAATASAWELGLSEVLIRIGLNSFAGGEQQTPGRFNLVETHGLTVIVDYGHNPSAVAALVEAIDGFPNPSRSVIFTAAGDRRDADLIRQGELLGDAFDLAFIYADKSTRGRNPVEIVALLREGLARGRRVAAIIEVGSESEAIAAALARSSPGALIVLQSDDSGDLSLELLRRKLDPASASTSAATVAEPLRGDVALPRPDADERSATLSPWPAPAGGGMDS